MKVKSCSRRRPFVRRMTSFRYRLHFPPWVGITAPGNTYIAEFPENRLASRTEESPLTEICEAHKENFSSFALRCGILYFFFRRLFSLTEMTRAVRFTIDLISKAIIVADIFMSGEANSENRTILVCECVYLQAGSANCDSCAERERDKYNIVTLRDCFHSNQTY